MPVSPTIGQVTRAAHRPSRKHAIVAAAMHLYATQPRDAISVADIAAEAQMTTTAIYYHYPTKDEVLFDGLCTFADLLVVEASSYLRSENASPLGLPLHLLDWMNQHRESAIVWFAKSDGLSTAIEGCRRSANERLLTAIVKSVRKHHRDHPLAHASVIGAALLALIEVSARAWLTDDAARVPGREDEFRTAVSDLAAKIVSTPAPP